ncbi:MULTISPECIES: hypothetical protein [unclassified Methanoculleus]|jgi:hypothetical protein|uniref:MmgE/PrpD family protein n=1 Tax=Methanoculleus palmolei TaxID=72612 RepID=A0ABD8AAJ5_9EURY|nr:hypothetical protein [Methanoculleus sp. UBA377]MDD2473265.1 hypothetical protein [Methanoculleus sp.]WOX56556.1 hypothetical protein R6Y95_04275 [Methanoculleus palmolei]
MSLPPLFRKYLSVLESSVTGRDSEELLSLREWVREAAAADNRPEKVQTLAGIGIACTYGSHTAGVWIGYIRDPSSVSPASVGRIPCCPGRGDYSSLFTVKEPVLRPELSVSNIGSGYAAAFSTCCREIGDEAAEALAGYIGNDDVAVLDAAVHRCVSEYAGSGMQPFADEFLSRVDACCKRRKCSA